MKYLILITYFYLNCASSDSVQNPNQNKTLNKKSNYDSGKTYHTGKRGGCYYLASTGRKEYVDRSLCR